MKRKNLINIQISIYIFFIIGFMTANIYSQEVPANLQAALFKKIFSFNKTLSAKGSVEIGVIGASGDGIVAAFKEAGINAKAMGGNQITGDVNVVYVMPGAASTKQQSASKGVLSISGVTSLVENGQVAIGLDIEGGKPKIVINMAQLKAEGQELTADLLKIVKVIQ